jgi:hypothetical protein
VCSAVVCGVGFSAARILNWRLLGRKERVFMRAELQAGHSRFRDCQQSVGKISKSGLV